jgi:hypothetical protein
LTQHSRLRRLSFANELEYGLQTAVEAKVLADVNGTSGPRHRGNHHHGGRRRTVLAETFTRRRSMSKSPTRSAAISPHRCRCRPHRSSEAVEVVGVVEVE